MKSSEANLPFQEHRVAAVESLDHHRHPRYPVSVRSTAYRFDG
jgi:hypothetical protein